MHYGEREKLGYFGRSGAHLSHELKNILATISETAGLMGDLIEMSGKDCDPAKLGSLCERITGLVSRGNATVRNLNGLAHSVDEPVREADLARLAALAAGLAGYAPFSREVALDLPEELLLTVRPFETLHLLTDTLRAAGATIDSSRRLGLCLRAEGGGAVAVVSGIGEENTGGENESLARALEVCAGLGTARLETGPGTWTLRLAPAE
jgi:hypothetical protein